MNLLQVPKIVVMKLIRVYKVCLSPLLPPACRFYPTCSEYTFGAVEHHGACKGLLMGAIRICKCQPFHPGGFDPVPESWSITDAFSRRPSSTDDDTP